MCMPELDHHVSAATCARIHTKPLHAWCPLVASHPPPCVHSHFHSSSWSQARVLFLHGQSTSAKLVQKILEDRGWFHDLPLQFFIPDGTHAVDAWSNKSVLKTLGLTGLVDAGLYDTSGKQFMWGARFSSLLEDFGRTHPAEALKAKVPSAAAITLRLFEPPLVLLMRSWARPGAVWGQRAAFRYGQGCGY